MPTPGSAKASGTIDDASVDLAALDTSRPNIARVYDYWLGGKDNISQVVSGLPHTGRTVAIQPGSSGYSKTLPLTVR